MGRQGDPSSGEGLLGVVALWGGLRQWEGRRLVWRAAKVLKSGAMLKGWQVGGSLRSPWGLLKVETCLDQRATHRHAEILSSDCILALSQLDCGCREDPSTICRAKKGKTAHK